jgi:hypothetical protein
LCFFFSGLYCLVSPNFWGGAGVFDTTARSTQASVKQL